MDAKEMLIRTKRFGYDCVDLCDNLDGSFLKKHVRGQLVRCSTSVSSNYRAARLAQSTASFVAKISIVIEEADESSMWIEMIIDKNLLSSRFSDESQRLMKEANELTSIFISTRKTVNSKNKHS
jgi:four helix bundle protein